MPQIETAALVSATDSKPDAPVTLSDRIDIAIGFLRRRYRSILVGLLICLPVGALYHYLTPATYTASTIDDDGDAEGTAPRIYPGPYNN